MVTQIYKFGTEIWATSPEIWQLKNIKISPRFRATSWTVQKYNTIKTFASCTVWRTVESTAQDWTKFAKLTFHCLHRWYLWQILLTDQTHQWSRNLGSWFRPSWGRMEGPRSTRFPALGWAPLASRWVRPHRQQSRRQLSNRCTNYNVTCHACTNVSSVQPIGSRNRKGAMPQCVKHL